MAEERESSGVEAERPPVRQRRPRLHILLAFLGAFLLLIIVFRGVLFPFLMAMFIAYLIEPAVQAFTKSKIFGIRWTRGPTIVLMYVVIIVGIVFGAIRAVAGTKRYVKKVSSDIARALHETAERARFIVVAPPQPPPIEPPDGEEDAEPLPPPGFSKDVRIPAGTRVVLAKDGGNEGDAPPIVAVHETLYALDLTAGQTEGTVLLRELEGVTTDQPMGTILDLEGIKFTDGTPVANPARRLLLEQGERAAGLYLLVEKRIITPVVANLEGAGFEVDPTELREILNTQARALGEDIPERATLVGSEFIGRLALSLYEFILILMLTAFMVMDRKRIAAFFTSLSPPHLRDEYLTLMRYIDRGLAGVIRGQLVICLVNGVLTYVGLLLFQVKGALLLSLFAGFLSLIPIFGTILSTIPIVLLALTDGIDKGLFALGWVMFIHLLEANMLNPVIMGSHARMHPVVIIFALLAGEHSFGVWGALLAVPTASIIQSCFQFYRYEIEGIVPEPEKPHGAWLRSVLGRVFGRAPPATASPEGEGDG